MTFDIKRINTVIIVTMENRSFDHMLGYLSLSNNRINGIRGDVPWSERYINRCDGSQPCAPFHLQSQLALTDDPPHETTDIAKQIGAPYPYPSNQAPMNGFMQSYAQTGVAADKRREVMGYYTDAEAPITGFFAKNFVICDRWFACLPTSTQPNRLMAMAGYSLIDNTFHDVIPNHRLVYEWLEERRNLLDWRVYHEGFPFFMLMPTWSFRILKDAVFEEKFRRLDDLENDLHADPTGAEVFFVEPKYTSDPLRTMVPSDDHSPSSIAGGQSFLRKIYCALKKNKSRWDRSLMIVMYDENGGFFDHESPLPIHTNPPPGASWSIPFATTGIRVPGMLISPLLKPGVLSEPLDHTSILKFLAERFDNGHYSDAVTNRDGVKNLRVALDLLGLDAARTEDLEPPVYNIDQSTIELATEQAKKRRSTELDKAFEAALLQIRDKYPDDATRKFPELKDFLRNPLWLNVEDQIRRGGMSIYEIDFLLEDCVKSGEMKLLAEPERRSEAVSNLAAFVQRLIDDTRARGERSIDRATFFNAKVALHPLWPFC
jgi:phospholipase C